MENHWGHTKGPVVGRTGTRTRLGLTLPAAGPGSLTLLIMSRERTSGSAFVTHLHRLCCSLHICLWGKANIGWLMAQRVKNSPALQESQVQWRREWQPTRFFLPGEFQGQRSSVGYSPWMLQRVGHDWVTISRTTPKILEWVHEGDEDPFLKDGAGQD